MALYKKYKICCIRLIQKYKKDQRLDNHGNQTTTHTLPPPKNIIKFGIWRSRPIYEENSSFWRPGAVVVMIARRIITVMKNGAVTVHDFDFLRIRYKSYFSPLQIILKGTVKISVKNHPDL